MPTTATIREANIAELREDAARLMVAHWAEVGAPNQIEGLDPNWDRYSKLEDAGLLIVLGAFVGEVIVGYSVSVITTHGHNQDQAQLHCDALFVDPRQRHTGAGSHLIAATEGVADDLDAQMVWHAKPDTPLDEIMSQRKRLQLIERVYARERRDG